MFSLVCALPSPASAEACASLFDWFTGTTAQSDFSGTCMSAVWFMAFADRSCSFEQDVREISRFSCMLFLSVRGFSDYAGPNSHSRNSVAAVLPSSISEGSRHPDPSAFRSSIARPTGTSGLRFTRHLTVPPAGLEARMESLFSFPVGLFHPLQHAGLSRRTPVCRRSGSYRSAAPKCITAAISVSSSYVEPTRPLLRDCEDGGASVRCPASARYSLHRRSHVVPLRPPGKAGRRRDGRGLQSQGHTSRPERCAEIPPRRHFPGPSGSRAIPPRSARRIRAQSSQHLHDSRHWRIRRPALHRHGAARGTDSQAPYRREAHRNIGTPGDRYSDR